MRPLLFIILLFVITLVSAQNETNIWYFGQNAGIDFNSGSFPPTILLDGQINTREGVASICNKSGQLLFYTEGTTVWNRNHNIMLNGTGLLGHYSSTQSAIIVPNPGDSTRYYIFTTSVENTNGYRYSEVDMTLAGGLGGIILSTKNTLINQACTEKLIAARHQNGKDYWLIIHPANSNEFKVYLITASGISAPQVYGVGSILDYTLGDWNNTGYLKISPDGSKIASVINGSLSKTELFNFNNSTGVITGPFQTLNTAVGYGAEFSPNSNFLYVSTLIRAPTTSLGEILQYDLTSSTLSVIQITSSSNLSYGALQLGPDKRIYVAMENGFNTGYDYLGVIHNPNLQGVACNFVNNGVYLGGRKTLIGLPTFRSDLFLSNTPFVCDGSFLLSTYPGPPPTTVFKINIGTPVVFNQIYNYSVVFNSIGYNRLDNFIYGFNVNNYHVIQVHNDGTYTDMGFPTGLITGAYQAGDVDRNGVYVISGNSNRIVRIDLSTTPPTVLSTATKYFTAGGAGNPVSSDMAFHPITGVLYGADQTARRMSRIDPVTGAVDAYGVLEPVMGGIGALVFDAFGDLYAYGNNTLYKVDLTTGALTVLSSGPSTSGMDACSCPYSLDLYKEVIPQSACPGDTVIYRFRMSNLTGAIIANVNFGDFLNSNLTLISGPSNLFGGTITAGSGSGTNSLEISGMNIPADSSSFTFLAVISNSVSGGNYLSNQAFLTGFGDTLFSDDPTTIVIDDSTSLLVNINVQYPLDVYLCPGSVYNGIPYYADTTFFENHSSPVGCDSTIVTFIHVQSAFYDTTISKTICSGDSVLIGGDYQNTAGVYTDTFKTISNCDSIVITNLSVVNEFFTPVAVSICPADSFFAQGAYQHTPGFYYDTLISTAGCDSVIETAISFIPAAFTNISVNLCQGDSLLVGGVFQSQQGVYYDTVLTPGGCDSVVVIALNIITPVQFSRTMSICAGDSIFAGGGYQFMSGIYFDTLVSFSGCDSILITNLSVIQKSFDSLSVTICEGESYLAGGSNQTESGFYLDTFNSVVGCDSIILTDLLVLDSPKDTVKADICEGSGYLAGGEIQTTSGFYYDTFTAQNGCDSSVITELTVFKPSLSDLDIKVCDGDSFFAGGAYQYITGVYRDTLIGQYGCDSVVLTNLEVLPKYFDIDLGADTILCNGEAFLLDASVPWTANYIWQDASTNSFYEVRENGAYSVEVYNQCARAGDTIQIEVEYCDCRLIVPNAFSPNGDGINDRFRIIYQCELEEFNIKIFNRWGQMVFESNDVDITWDGTFKGEPVPLSVFTWMIEYRGAYETKSKAVSGDVTVVR